MGTNPCHSEKKRKDLNSSLKLFILKFIPPCLMQPFLLSFPCSQRTNLGTAVQSPHCIGLFPSTCALEPVRLCDSSLQFSLKYTQTRYALTYTLSRVVTFLEGRGTKLLPLFGEWENPFLRGISISLPQLPPIFKWIACAMAHCATHFGKADFRTSQKSQLSWQTFRFNSWRMRQIFHKLL